MHTNPFHPETDAKRHRVANLLLSGETVAWSDLIDAAHDKLSPRTMGYILRALEEQGATILRLRHPQFGTLYRYDARAEFDERFRISKANGPDAMRGKTAHEATAAAG